MQHPSFAQPMYWYTPCGGMFSSTNDMLSYAGHLLQKDLLLYPSVYESYFLPGVELSDDISSFGRAGWEIAYANGFRTITKNGVSGGFSSHLVLVPELKLGLFGWINVDANQAASTVCFCFYFHARI